MAKHDKYGGKFWITYAEGSAAKDLLGNVNDSDQNDEGSSENTLGDEDEKLGGPSETHELAKTKINGKRC